MKQSSNHQLPSSHMQVESLSAPPAPKKKTPLRDLYLTSKTVGTSVSCSGGAPITPHLLLASCCQTANLRMRPELHRWRIHAAEVESLFVLTAENKGKSPKPSDNSDTRLCSLFLICQSLTCHRQLLTFPVFIKCGPYFTKLPPCFAQLVLKPPVETRKSSRKCLLMSQVKGVPPADC